MFSQNSSQQISYPIRFTYVNKINNWWPPEKIAEGLGLPQIAQYHLYNFIALSFWTFQHGPVDMVTLWGDPVKYFGADSKFGTTKDQIQKNLKQKYNANGIKIMISAFGATQFPTTSGVNPVACAQKLGQFVLENNLDGVDIDWEDNPAMQAGTGEQWLIVFTIKLRQILPSHIISHAPQAPYFCAERYKNGAYVTVHKQVGHLINFYNIQFYNQGNNSYDCYESLFIKSGGNFEGTSVKQIAQRGVPIQKIVVGKPATQGDATNTGFMQHHHLSEALVRAHHQGKWQGGVMLWQYSSDLDGKIISNVASNLKSRVNPH